MIILILILIMMVGLKQELGGSSGHGGQLDRVPGAILGEATTSLSHSTHPQIQIRTQIQIHTQIQTTYIYETAKNGRYKISSDQFPLGAALYNSLKGQRIN